MPTSVPERGTQLFQASHDPITRLNTTFWPLPPPPARSSTFSPACPTCSLALLSATMPSPTAGPLLPAPPSPYRRLLGTIFPLCLVCVAVPVLLTVFIHLRPRRPPSGGGVKAGAAAAADPATATALAAATSPADVLAATSALVGRDRCGLWGMSGHCRAALRRYEWRHGSCEAFVWGGCGGLVPFETKAACEAAMCSEGGGSAGGDGEGLAEAVQAAWRRVGGSPGLGGRGSPTFRGLL